MKRIGSKLFFCFFFLTLVAGEAVNAQPWVSPREWRRAFRSDDYKILSGFDSHRSFISGRTVTIFGAQGGVELDHVFRIGSGVYFLQTPFYRNFMVLNPDTGELEATPTRLRFHYMTFFVDPIFLQTKRWELDAPLSLGVGDSHYDALGRRREYEAQTVVMAEMGLQATYRIVQWIGLGAGLGWRQMIRGNEYLREDFTAPTYRLGVRLFTGVLYKQLFKKETS